MGGSGRISPTSAIAVPTDFPNSVRGAHFNYNINT